MTPQYRFCKAVDFIPGMPFELGRERTRVTYIGRSSSGAFVVQLPPAPGPVKYRSAWPFELHAVNPVTPDELIKKSEAADPSLLSDLVALRSAQRAILREARKAAAPAATQASFISPE